MVDLKAKPFNLNDTQIKWVEDTIASMTEDEKVGQLFMHLTGCIEEEDVKEELSQIKIGGIRFNPKSKEEMWTMNNNYQKHSRIPILSAVNVESGGLGATKDGTHVGSEMKVAATNDSKYAYELGRIAGIETKAVGSNWAFTPIIDLVQDWHNPGIVTRGFSDETDKVLEFSKEYFRGMSESGIPCAMKHFPGDGSDERDPHVCTSVNALSIEEWDNSYGKIYKGMIEAGVQSLMTGHIMMPAYQRYFNPSVKDEDLMPATICPELLQGLLREKLGFNGLVVTDASHMIGLTARAKRSDLVPGAIIAGCDMFLFYNDIAEDTKYMKDAIHDGRLTLDRLHDALRRILGLKAVAGLCEFTMDKFPKKEGLSVVGCAEHKKIADEVADKSVTLAKHIGENIFPITTKKNKRILLVEVGPKPSPFLVMSGQMVDGSQLTANLKGQLEKRGFEVEIYVDPIQKMMAQMQAAGITDAGDGLKAFNKASMGGGGNANKGMYGNKQSVGALTSNYDLVICYANVSSTMKTAQRLEWAVSKGGWDNPWYVNEIPTIFVSFNCPFHLADVPQIKNYINCYDAGDNTIDALVKKLTGESKFTGVSPVDVFCGMIDTKI